MEQPPYDTEPKLAEYLTRQLRNLSHAVSSASTSILTFFSTIFGQAQIYLNGALGNRIDMGANGVGIPLINAISLGTKIILYPFRTATDTDAAIGIENNHIWHSIPIHTDTVGFKWYGAVTQIARLSGIGNLTIAGNLAAANYPPAPAVRGFGGMRKTSFQNVGNLGAGWVTVNNYQVEVFTTHQLITVGLVQGTLAPTALMNCVFQFNAEFTFTSDNNSSRNFHVQLYSNINGAVVPNADLLINVGAYAAGATISEAIPTSVQTTNNEFVIRIGGGSTFAAFVITSAMFAIMEL
jgi:hypothetical protein